MSQKVKIKYEQIQDVVVGEVPDYPKYTTQILNLANQNAQGTRPKVVGQMSELIQEFDGRTVEEWIAWYEERYPEARKNSTDKIEDMVNKLKDAIDQIDREMIDTWVKYLVLYKTFIGLRFQEAILKQVAEIKDTSYRVANKEEESKGIGIIYKPWGVAQDNRYFHQWSSRTTTSGKMKIKFESQSND